MKIALEGVGHRGKIHRKCLLKTEVKLAGFCVPAENGRKLFNSLGFLGKETQFVKIENHTVGDIFSGMTMHTNDSLKRIIIESPSVMQSNIIEDELNDFYEAVANEPPDTIAIEDGFRSLEQVQFIEDKIEIA